VAQLRSCDSPFLQQRTKQQRLQASDQDSADPHHQDGCQLHWQRPFTNPADGHIHIAFSHCVPLHQAGSTRKNITRPPAGLHIIQPALGRRRDLGPYFEFRYKRSMC
jgi:hypothetical protein